MGRARPDQFSKRFSGSSNGVKYLRNLQDALPHRAPQASCPPERPARRRCSDDVASDRRDSRNSHGGREWGARNVTAREGW
eukprot:ctg_955.g362